MISDLPLSSQLKKCASTLNAQFEIRDAPEGIVGVQHSIKSRLKFLLTHVIHNFRENGNLIAYESFVNKDCKVRFNFRIDKDTKNLIGVTLLVQKK